MKLKLKNKAGGIELALKSRKAGYEPVTVTTAAKPEGLKNPFSGKKPYVAGGTRNKWIPDERTIERIEFLSGTGLNQEQICHVIGVSVDTFAKRIKEGYSELAEAVKKGRSKGVAIVVNSLFESAKNGNLGAQCFFLKNTAGWTDRQDLAMSGKDGGPLHVVIGKLESRF